MESLDELERVKAKDFLRKAKYATEQYWSNADGGLHPVGVNSVPTADATYSSTDDHDQTPQGSEQDEDAPEVEGSGKRLSAFHLQKQLLRLLDCTRLRALEATLRRQCNWEQLERLRDLRNPNQSHRWLWRLDVRAGAVLAQADYIIAVQKRLGARVYNGSGACRLCGVPLDACLSHAETCATAEATRGHDACVRALVAGFRLSDPSVTTEPRGLTEAQSRPADILTTAAVPGRGAALDICIASPNAAIAMGDAAEAAFRRKLHHYRAIIPQLTQAGLAFRPLVWTADGRPHAAATRTMKFAAQLAAARGGQEFSAGFLGRWKHEVQVTIQRRRAAMARSVVPRLSPQEAWLLTGCSEAQPGEEKRAPLLEEDEDSEKKEEWREDAAMVVDG